MRYAIYFVPEPDTDLALFGAAWLGRDIESGRALDRPAAPGFTSRQIDAITAAPRRYGFHATLKPPFHLREGRAEDALLEAAERFALSQAAFVGPKPKLAAIGRFLALVPEEPCEAIDRLAGACVEHFDGFRRPASEQENARRREANLTPRQDALLSRWGYPYVFDEFRFHMTLTAELDAATRGRIAPVLETMASPVLRVPLAFRSLTVVVEPEPGGAFMLRRRYPLRSS